MTLSDMAREIERRRPGTLPKSLGWNLPNPLDTRLWIVDDDHSIVPSCPDDLAHAILRDAMVMAIGDIQRCHDHWRMHRTMQDLRPIIYFDDHNENDPTRSLFAAFCAAFPEDKT